MREVEQTLASINALLKPIRDAIEAVESIRSTVNAELTNIINVCRCMFYPSGIISIICTSNCILCASNCCISSHISLGNRTYVHTETIPTLELPHKAA